MKALVYEDVRTVGVRDVPDATIEADSDVVVRVTSSALCGSDLHMYDGRIGATAGLVLGHEPLGVVEQVGRAVETITPGMRVVLPTHLFCGTCHMCARGLSAACLRARPDGLGAAYGYAGMGPYRGAQAELLRVPWADANCIRLPGEPGEQIREHRSLTGLPLGEAKLGGVDKVIDAVGFQARDRDHPDRERPGQVVSDAARLVNPAGTVGIAGVYPQRDSDPRPGETPDGNLTVPWGGTARSTTHPSCTGSSTGATTGSSRP
jgi:threonine dehydrogenase-like Zn-dependent dehydrogenase